MANRTLTLIAAMGALITPALPGWSQSVCPGVPFLTAPVIPGRSGDNINVLKRESNGSFTAVRFRIPSYEIATQETHFDSKVKTCFPTRVSSSGPPATPPGVGSPAQFAVAGDFFGNGSMGWVQARTYDPTNIDVVQVTDTLTVVGSLPVAVGRKLLAVDLNGDGRTDLVVAGRGDSNQIYVLLSGGGPNVFTRTADLTAGGSPTSITAGDVNGDGKIDLIATDTSSGNGDLYVFFGDGKGGFKPAGKLTVGSPAASVAIGDWNGDGKADLAVAGHASDPPQTFDEFTPNYVTILLGNGDGTFGAPKRFLAGSEQTSIAPADLNRDGKLDLVTTNSSNNTVMVFLGRGDGTFDSALGYAVGDGPNSVVITDFDGDGILDIVVGYGEPRLILPNSPETSSSFDVSTITVLLGRGDGTFWGAPAYPLEPYTVKTSIGDVNGDGFPDLIAAGAILNNVENISGVYISLGRGDGVFGAFQPARTPQVPVFFTALRAFPGDFNSDGIADLLTVGALGTSVFTGQSDGSYQMLNTADMGGEPFSVLDLDHDGKLDLLVPGYSNGAGSSVEVRWGSGAGTFEKLDLQPAMIPEWAAAADLNGDSLLDVVAIDSIGTIAGVTVYSWLAHGDRTFGPPSAVSAGLNPIAAALADVNGDGKIDVIAVCRYAWNIGFSASFPALLVFLGNGDGSFQSPIVIPDVVFDSPQLGPIAAVAGDFDRDGIPDIVFASQCIGPFCGSTSGNYLGFLKGNGDGTFRTAVRFSVGPKVVSLAVADLNGDQWPDLVVGGERGSTIVFLNQPPVPRPLVNVSAASFIESVQCPNAIVSAFGDHLATTTAAARSLTLPTTLGGTSVVVTDTLGTQAQAELYYVSQDQVNYVMPPGLANGPATVTIRAADGVVRQSEIILQPTATSVFGINASGLAAAEVHRVRNGVAQPPEQVYRIESGAIVPAPIDLGPASDEVFLRVYATGVRNAPGLYALLGETLVPTATLGPEGTLAGLDQITMGPIPRSLAGKGRAAIALYGYRITSTAFVMIK